MIKKLQNERAELKTFDDVLAQLYADKTGKTVEECLAQMKKGNWLTAQQAVDFGLVDSMREDKAAEDAADEFSNQFVNLYIFQSIQGCRHTAVTSTTGLGGCRCKCSDIRG